MACLFIAQLTYFTQRVTFCIVLYFRASYTVEAKNSKVSVIMKTQLTVLLQAACAVNSQSKSMAKSVCTH